MNKNIKYIACNSCGMFPDEAIALRLRRICNQLNLQSAVPDDNNELYRSMFSVLGMIARKLDKTNAPTVQREGCEKLYWQLAKQAYKLALLDTYLKENNIQPPTDNIFVKAGCEQFGVDVDWKTISGTRTFYGDGMVEAIFSVGKDEIVTVITHESVKDIAINYINQQPTVQREGWVSVPIDLLKDITNCFDNVPSRAHVADGVDDNLKRIAQWVNSSDGGYGLYQAVNNYLLPAAPTDTE